MSAVWITIAGLTLVTVAIKSSGPLTVGRSPSPRVLDVVEGLAPALLAALVVAEAVGKTDGGGLSVDARLAGLAAAGAALALRAPLILVIGVGALTAAAARAMG
jgi:hypothetical protein